MAKSELKQAQDDELVLLLRDALPVIDRDLAVREFPLHQRTFQAAIEFVQHCVLFVREAGNNEATPGNSQEFIATRWFVGFHAELSRLGR